MPASPIRKLAPFAADAKKRGIKVYHLNIGQPDLPTPEEGLEALKHVDRKVLEYSPSQGYPQYLEKLVGYYKRYDINLSVDDIIVTCGGSEAVQMAFMVCLNPGDEIIIPEPAYANYMGFACETGAKVRTITTHIEDGFALPPVEEFEKVINERTRAIMITNPGNPTGAVLEPEELKLMLDIAKEHDLLIVCDEVYREFVYGGEPLMSALQFEGYEQNVVVIDSVSKRFSACGARVGMLISRNQDFMRQAMKWCQCRLCSATVDQVAAAALYRLDPSYFDAVREEYKRRRDTLMRCLKKIPGVVCREPKGAFYVMAALPVDDSDRFQHWLLNEFDDHGDTVLFACGEPFYGTPGKGKNEVRMAYTINCADIERAMEVLAVAIEKYNAK